MSVKSHLSHTVYPAVHISNKPYTYLEENTVMKLGLLKSQNAFSTDYATMKYLINRHKYPRRGPYILLSAKL